MFYLEVHHFKFCLTLYYTAKVDVQCMRLVILVIIDISVEVIKIPNSFVPEYFLIMDSLYNFALHTISTGRRLFLMNCPIRSA